MLLTAIGHALMMSFAMTWEILWALILGFGLSAIIQAVVSKEEMSRLPPDDSARTVAVACGLGAASSSCSYAAALARSMFRKGANFTAAMAFQFASTNLVVELGMLLALLMDWQFTLAEFTGGPLMIAIMVLLFKAFLTPRIVEAARQQADKGIQRAHGRTCRYGHVYSRRNRWPQLGQQGVPKALTESGVLVERMPARSAAAPKLQVCSGNEYSSAKIDPDHHPVHDEEMADRSPPLLENILCQMDG